MSATVALSVVVVGLALFLVGYVGNNAWRIRQESRDAAEHRRFVDYIARMRAAGAAQARDPRTAEISRRFALKITGQPDPTYIGRHRRSAIQDVESGQGVVSGGGRHRRVDVTRV